jgi:hypothetical protein
MLADIGLSMADLFADIPADLRYENFHLPAGLSEQQVRNRLAELVIVIYRIIPL